MLKVVFDLGFCCKLKNKFNLSIKLFGIPLCRKKRKDKNTLGCHSSNVFANDRTITIYLSAFFERFDDEDKLIKSISKTIAHEYVHDELRKLKTIRWWKDHYAIYKMGLMGL